VDVASNQALPVLRRGSTGKAVRRRQRSLVISELLPNTGINRIFGPATERAVRGFQQAVGVGVDGIVGPKTWAQVPEPPVLPVLRRARPAIRSAACSRDWPRSPKGWEWRALAGWMGISGLAGRRRGDASSGSLVFPPLTGVVGDHTWHVQVGGVCRLLGFAGLSGDEPRQPGLLASTCT
jgi:hypothetical protein